MQSIAIILGEAQVLDLVLDLPGKDFVMNINMFKEIKETISKE